MAKSFNYISLSSVSIPKGVFDYVELANKIVYKYPSDKFYWIGTGDIPKGLDGRNVCFTGFLNEKEKKRMLTKSNTIFLNCSHFEGFSVPIAEACLLKVPVLCYKLPELYATYGPHINYVNCYNSNEFFKCLELLRKNFVIYKEKAVLARRFVIENYSAHKFTSKFMNSLEVLNERRIK